MKTFQSIFVAILVFGCLSTVNGQNLDIDQLDAAQPPWLMNAAPVAAGTPVFGYQFQFGSFSVQPGNPPGVHGIFVLGSQQFPQGTVQKLYSEQLEYLGFNAGGPLEGAVFRCSVNGNERYFLFGTLSQGTQNGIQLRRIRYFNQNGFQTFSTLARFYAP
jgi:hypothetical protein